MSRETIAQFEIASTPLQLGVQLAIAGPVARSEPLTLFMAAFPVRIALNLLYLPLIYGGWFQPGSPPPVLALGALFLLSNGVAATSSLLFAAMGTFFNRVADPDMGGTYLTALNTAANLGSKWAAFVALRALDATTSSACVGGREDGAVCAGADGRAVCVGGGGGCVDIADGFPPLALGGAVVSILWWVTMRKRVTGLQGLPTAAWAAKRAVGGQGEA